MATCVCMWPLTPERVKLLCLRTSIGSDWLSISTVTNHGCLPPLGRVNRGVGTFLILDLLNRILLTLLGLLAGRRCFLTPANSLQMPYLPAKVTLRILKATSGSCMPFSATPVAQHLPLLWL